MGEWSVHSDGFAIHLSTEVGKCGYVSALNTH